MKPSKRLKRALWALNNPREIEINRNWNIKHRRHKWTAQLEPHKTKEIQ